MCCSLAPHPAWLSPLQVCLEFVSRILGFEEFFARGSAIDGSCLGGPRGSDKKLSFDVLKPYWAGRKDTWLGRRVGYFLEDYKNACSEIAGCVRPGGRVVLVVGQRSTGGYRLKLDRFTADTLEEFGMRPISVQHRRLKDKRLPRTINRYARCASKVLRTKGVTRTISDEIILAFEKEF
jgi:hypothetical protein